MIYFCFFVSWIPEDDGFQKEKMGQLPSHSSLCLSSWDKLRSSAGSNTCKNLCSCNWKSEVFCGCLLDNVMSLWGIKGIWLMYFMISLIMLYTTFFVGHYKTTLLNSEEKTWQYSPLWFFSSSSCFTIGSEMTRPYKKVPINCNEVSESL